MGDGAQPCLVRGAWSAPSLWNGPLFPIRDSVHVNTVGEPCEVNLMHGSMRGDWGGSGRTSRLLYQ